MKLSKEQKLERFLTYIDKHGPMHPILKTRCWDWIGGRYKRGGYGHTCLIEGTSKAHRASWIVFIGPIPEGLWVLHKCDRGCCVNPKHLFVGTPQDNMTDMVTKGRSLTGDKNPARLYPENLARGDASGPRKHPESYVDKLPSGDDHWSVLQPEKVPCGEIHSNHVLTEQKVREIRRDYEPYVVTVRILAEKYGVSMSTINRILGREDWKHVK